MPTAAAQILVTVIPIVGIVAGTVVLFVYLFWNHKQKMLMIERGIYQKPEFDLNTFSIFTGLVLSSIGVSLMTFFMIMDGFSYGVLSGMIPLCLGISLIVFFIIRKA
jgi:hypothetical protein